MKKKLKIAFVLIAYSFAGGERAVFQIIRSLSKMNNVKITLFTNTEIIPFYSSLKNIKIVNLGAIYNQNVFLLRSIIPILSRRLEKYLKNESYDAIHLHMESPMEMVGRFKNMPNNILSTFHGSDLVIFSKSFAKNSDIINERGLVYFLKMIYYRNIIRPYLLKTLSNNTITLVGGNQKNSISEEYKKKTIVIPNGVDSKIFKPLKNIKQKKNVILFTGRFIDIKGIKEILSVAKQLPQYEFWFAGQGPLANLINLPNTKNLGFKSTEGLVKLYNQATICIAPSHRESFGLVGLEAMSCQKAVIVTPLGFSEYIENEKDGIIIPVKDEKALKDAIVDLMENPKKRKRLEKNARKKALKYSWDKIAKQYLKVFKEVIRENKKKNKK